MAGSPVWFRLSANHCQIAYLAAELMQTVAPLVGAKGGGRPDLARAGGGDQVDAIEQALTAARQWAFQPAGFISNRGIFAAQVSVSMDE